MKHVPHESRDAIDALKVGRSPEQFLDHMWLERAMENRRETKSHGKWPCTVYEAAPSNVTQLRKRSK